MSEDRFEHCPCEYFADDVAIEAGQRSFDRYMRYFTGSRFEETADRSKPDEITLADIVAVSTLGVHVPAAAALWLLNEGAATVSELLSEIPAGPIWETPEALAPGGAAERLWYVVRGIEWNGQHGHMGRTKTSKLLAAKRPHLVPIFDRRVEQLLHPTARIRSWTAWTVAFDECGDRLREVAERISGHVDAEERPSVLRTIDIALWMRFHPVGML